MPPPRSGPNRSAKIRFVRLIRWWRPTRASTMLRAVGPYCDAKKQLFDFEDLPRDVVEDWRGKADRVDSIEHTAVAFDQRAVIAHAAISFNGRHRHCTGEAHHGDDHRHERSLPDLLEWG